MCLATLDRAQLDVVRDLGAERGIAVDRIEALAQRRHASLAPAREHELERLVDAIAHGELRLGPHGCADADRHRDAGSCVDAQALALVLEIRGGLDERDVTMAPTSGVGLSTRACS